MLRALPDIRRISRRHVLALGTSALLPRSVLGQEKAVSVMRFSSIAEGAPLPAWLEPVTFGGNAKPTEFALVQDGGQTVLRAYARASASGLARMVRVDPGVHPVLAWRWKTTN